MDKDQFFIRKWPLYKPEHAFPKDIGKDGKSNYDEKDPYKPSPEILRFIQKVTD